MKKDLASDLKVVITHMPDLSLSEKWFKKYEVLNFHETKFSHEYKQIVDVLYTNDGAYV